VLFWLSRLLQPGTRLFDWGGNVGTSYFAYRPILAYPEGFDWLVQDVPAVVAAGRALPPETAPGLRFTEALDGLAASDILLAAGALHFIPDPFGPLWAAADRLPRHILLNKVPAYDQPDAVTLQNQGASFCANHLFNRIGFEAVFTNLGYRVVDTWQTPGLGCYIPFHPAHSIEAYSGWYLTRE
jgi:putative methyltransferase (TIGR04325 family)